MSKKYYKNKKEINHKRNKKIAFYILIIFPCLFLISNYFGGNNILKFISNSLLIQTVLMDLALVTLIDIFFPFNLPAVLSNEEVENISSKEFKKILESENETNRIKKEASF